MIIDDSLLRYSPNDDYFLSYAITKPSAKLKNIKIQNSSNANFLSLILDEGVLDNVELNNVYFNGTALPFPLFLFENVNRVTVKNIVG